MSEWTKEMADAHNQKVAVGRGLSPMVQLESAMVKATVSITPFSEFTKLNKTEKAFYAELKRRPNLWVGCQNITLKLGDDCRYTPDFPFIQSDGRIVFYEVKGFWRDDAKVKIKVAARLFSWAAFVVVQKTKVGWTETPVNP